MGVKRFIVRTSAKNPELKKVTITVDECDAHLLRSYPWMVSISSHGTSIFRPSTKFCRNADGQTLGSAIMNVAVEGMCVEHIDGDPLNFRRDNLRQVTRREHMANMENKRHPREAD